MQRTRYKLTLLAHSADFALSFFARSLFIGKIRGRVRLAEATTWSGADVLHANQAPAPL